MNAKQMVKQLLQPTLMYELKSKRQSSPHLLSHVGGHPYTEANDRLPICRLCKHAMHFIFQLHIPNAKSSVLYSFYYCMHCQPKDGQKGFVMKQYKAPSVGKMVHRPAWKSVISHAVFELEPQWSLPEWDELPFIDKSLQPKLIQTKQDQAEVVYEEAAEELLGEQPFEVFSFFGGYPKFLGFPYYPVCPHCQETMELFVQVDTDDQKQLIWTDYGCLYVFRCKHESSQFSILIQ